MKFNFIYQDNIRHNAYYDVSFDSISLGYDRFEKFISYPSGRDLLDFEQLFTVPYGYTFGSYTYSYDDIFISFDSSNFIWGKYLFEGIFREVSSVFDCCDNDKKVIYGFVDKGNGFGSQYFCEDVSLAPSYSFKSSDVFNGRDSICSKAIFTSDYFYCYKSCCFDGCYDYKDYISKSCYHEEDHIYDEECDCDGIGYTYYFCNDIPYCDYACGSLGFINGGTKVLGFYNDGLSDLKIKYSLDLSNIINFSSSFNKEFFIVLNIYDYNHLDVDYSCEDNFVDILINSTFKMKFKERFIVGAFKVFNSKLYLVEKGFLGDIDWFNHSLCVNDVEGLVDVDFYEFYINGNVSSSIFRNLNVFGKCWNFELVEVSQIMACSDECMLNLIDALNNLSSKLSLNCNGVNHSIAFLFNEAFNTGCSGGSVFKNSINDEVFSIADLIYDFRDYFRINLGNNNFLGFADMFKNTFLSGNNLDKSVFRTLLNIDFSDSFSSAFNMLSGVGSVFANNAINPANYRSIYDDFHDSFYNSNCGSWFLESFNEAFNLINCQGSVFKANDNIWSDEDTLAGILFKNIDSNYVVLNNVYSPFYCSYSSGSSVKHWCLPDLIVNSLYRTSTLSNVLSGLHSVFNIRNNSNFSFSDILNNSLFSDNTDNSTPSKSNSVFVFGRANSDNFKILNHSCNVNPCSIKFCENPSVTIFSGDTPINISTGDSNIQVDVNLPEDDLGDPIPFKIDWKPLLNLLSEALFCQFGNSSSSPRSSWFYSVFNKLLYPNNSNDCDEKVGLPELDFSEGFVPDNIFVNSNGLIARFNSEIYK